MPTIYSNDFVSTLRRFVERSPNAERLKREVRENIASIEAGSPDDKPARMRPEERLHVCEGARFGVVYALVDDTIQVKHLERIAL